MRALALLLCSAKIRCAGAYLQALSTVYPQACTRGLWVSSQAYWCAARPSKRY